MCGREKDVKFVIIVVINIYIINLYSPLYDVASANIHTREWARTLARTHARTHTHTHLSLIHI